MANKFDQLSFGSFCEKYGITHNFSVLRTAQQNGGVEKKNRTLEEMAKTIFIENRLAMNKAMMC